MGSFTDYWENKVLEHTVGKTSVTMPTIYVALCTTAPTDAAAGTAAAYTSYARVATAGSDWASASGGNITNANAITFPAATGGSETVTHFELWDASSAGNRIAWGSLSAGLAVSSGITPKFNAGALSINLD